MISPYFARNISKFNGNIYHIFSRTIDAESGMGFIQLPKFLMSSKLTKMTAVFSVRPSSLTALFARQLPPSMIRRRRTVY